MATLNDYLRTSYDQDMRQLQLLQDLVSETVPTLIRFWDDAKKTWPYAVSQDSHAPVKKELSLSTHSMILQMLMSLKGTSSESILFPKAGRPLNVDLPKDDQEKLDGIIGAADTKLLGDLLDRVNLVTSDPNKSFSDSTFGVDDPLTLTWVWEYTKHWPREKLKSLKYKTANDEKKQVVKGLKAVAKKTINHDELLKWIDNPRRHNVVDHAFLHLRRNVLARISGNNKVPTPSSYFENTLHEQLAFSMIRDSRFDPATLAFCLEGALQLDELAYPEGTLEQVFAALEQAQETSSHWRPVIPFITTETGMVLFPVSVEIANSLLRSCQLLDAKMKDSRYFIRLEPLIRRYFAWVQSRVVRGEAGSKKFVGWHSEHVNEEGLIHLWESSQVILFMLQYAASLQQKVAIEGVQAANLSRRLPGSIDRFETYWLDEPFKALKPKGKYKIIEQTKLDFIDRGEKGAVLLYGPPGTGKTTYAEQLAVELKWPLIVVTVSDFLEGGAPEVEARAKGIFKVLCEQSDVVVLLDEMDQFLLDRNSVAFQNQTDIFQFMTNGMLTKLQDLKDEENCILVVATNYYERIDTAIRRRGRMDYYYYLSLPDCVQRFHLLFRFLTDKKNLGEDSVVGKAGEADFAAHAKTSSLGKKTTFFSYGDLKHLVKSLVKGKTPQLRTDSTVEEIVTELESKAPDVNPPVSLASYEGQRTKDEAFEEFFLLVYLLAEVEKKPLRPEEDAITAAIEKIGEEDLETRLKAELKDEEILKTINVWLKEHGLLPNPSHTT